MRRKFGFDADLAALLRGAGTVFAIRTLGGALLYLSHVLVAQWLGAQQFGLFNYAWSWAYVLGVLATLGLPNSSLRFIPQYRARSEGGNLLRFTRFAWLTAAASGTCAMLAAWLVLIAGAATLQPVYRSGLMVAMAGVPILAVSVLQVQMARAAGHVMLAFAPVQLARPLLFILFGFFWMAMITAPNANTFLGLTIAAFAVVTAAQGLMLLRSLRAQGGQALDRTAADPAEGSRQWLRASLPMLVFSGAQIALVEIGIILVGLLLSPEEVALYAAAARTAMLLRMVTMAMDTMTVPKVAALHARAQHRVIGNLLRGTMRTSSVLALAVMLVMIAGGKLILGLFGPGFVEGYHALVILAVGFALCAAIAPVPGILNVTGHQDVVTWASLVLLGANVLLGLVLIPRFGVVGAAITTAAAAILLRGALLGVLSRRLGIVGVIAPAGLAGRVLERPSP